MAGRQRIAPKQDDFTPLSLGTQSVVGRFMGPDGGSRLVNCYAEQLSTDGEQRFPVYAIDGQEDYLTFAAGPVRQALVLDETRTLLAVSAHQLNEAQKGLDGTLTQSAIGGILENGLVTMVRNRNVNPMAAIVVGGQYYLWQAGTLIIPNDPDLPPPNSVAHLDGYFIFGIDDGRWFISNIDSSEVDPLSFASAEGNPDGLRRVATRGRELVLFGQYSNEFWRNTGASPFPFERTTITEGSGILAAGSVASIEETLIYVQSDGTVRSLEGYTAVRISNHGVEQAIADEADLTALTAYSVKRRGHSFYVLNGENFTYVYDATTTRWHERQSQDLLGNVSGRWRCSCYVKFDEQDIFGSNTEGKMYRSHQSLYSESGNPIVLTMQPPTIHAGSRFILDALKVEFVAGQGLNTPDAPETNDPQLMIRTSMDGGVTFGGERRQTMGKQGERIRRIVERQFGQFYDQGCTVQLRTSAAVARGFNIMGIKARKLAA